VKKVKRFGGIKNMTTRKVNLQLLCTNDTHSSMESEDTKTDSNLIHLFPLTSEVGGASRRARCFSEMRKEADATLVFDAETTLQGVRILRVCREKQK
jgi:2',3'-cyclic-nucleotide 2'-phosphodiesterase (5'-nucleotidase family)